MRQVLLILAVVAITYTIRMPSAQACLNGTIMEQNQVVKNVKLAANALGKGQNKKVLRLLKADHYMVESGRLMRQVHMLKAVARMRLGKSKGAERLFRRLLAKDKDNPLLQTRLAEALHKKHGHEAIEAWRIMDDLEERDLIPDAQGYAVLAKLRKRNKDLAGYERAMTACKQMAGKRAGLCSS